MKRSNTFNDAINSKKAAVSKILDVYPNFYVQTKPLCSESTSNNFSTYLLSENALTIDDFEQLWKIKPNQKLQIKVADTFIDCPRFSKSFLTPYNFNSMERDFEPKLPDVLENLFNYTKSLNPEINNCYVNWYEADGGIGKHSDDEKLLVQDSSIYSFSFGPAKRNFYLEPKNQANNENLLSYRIKLRDNTLIIMNGESQNTHVHYVPKIKNDDSSNGRRINVTFRCLKNF